MKKISLMMWCWVSCVVLSFGQEEQKVKEVNLDGLWVAVEAWEGKEQKAADWVSEMKLHLAGGSIRLVESEDEWFKGKYELDKKQSLLNLDLSTKGVEFHMSCRYELIGDELTLSFYGDSPEKEAPKDFKAAEGVNVVKYKRVKQVATELEGRWELLKSIDCGDELKGVSLVMDLIGSTAFTEHESGKGVVQFSIDEKAKPKRFCFISADKEDEPMKFIYKVEDGVLTMCIIHRFYMETSTPDGKGGHIRERKLEPTEDENGNALFDKDGFPLGFNFKEESSIVTFKLLKPEKAVEKPAIKNPAK